MTMTRAKNPTPVLCFVKGDCAFFTTQPLEKQMGDDWNVTPYEHNAGLPHESDCGDWEIIKVYFDEANLKTPADRAGGNCKYSVEDINIRRQTPWLQTPDGPISILLAGTPLDEFKRIIKSIGGEIYVLEP